MKSPFPGMDPYLEARWSDVHVKLIGFIGEALQPLLPRDLRARSEERVLLEDVLGDSQAYRSDVAVVELPRSAKPAPRRKTATAAGVATLDPIFVSIPDSVPFDRFVQIIDLSNGNRVVTAIEILSPWNKRPGRLHDAYRKKLDDYAAGGVSVVELDLLRGSRGRLDVGQQDLPADRRTSYLACIRRASHPSRWEIYPLSLRDPLPCIPVPLRSRDADVGLEMQPLIDRVYTAGGHDDIDYTKPPEPPLEAEDAVWAAGLVGAARPAG